MRMGSTDGWSGVASDVTSAVATIAAAAPSDAAAQTFVTQLHNLADALNNRVKYPPGVIGDQDVALIQHAATAAGCQV
jgi:hypothetical protein